MKEKKMLKISGVCLLIYGIISSITMFIINFIKKDEVIKQLSEQLSSLNADTSKLANLFFIFTIIGTIITLLIQFIISKKAIDYANGKSEKTTFITLSLILAIIVGSTIINFNNSLVGILSFIFNLISIIIYLLLVYYGNKIKKENEEIKER